MTSTQIIAIVIFLVTMAAIMTEKLHRTVAAVAGALLLIYGWVYNIRMAGANLAVDIAAYVVILALGFAVALWIPVTKRWRSPLLMLTGVLAVLVVVFTFYTPDTLLFADLELADALYTLPC